MNDLIVIRGYAIACGEIAGIACDESDAAVARMVAAREDFDAAAERGDARDVLNAAAERLDAARVEAALARQRAGRELANAERHALFAARCMGGTVSPESIADVAEAIRALVGPLSRDGEAA